MGRENCNKLDVDIKEQLEVKVRSNQIWQDHRPRDYKHNMRAVLTPPHLIGFTVVHIKSTNKELSSQPCIPKKNTIQYDIRVGRENCNKLDVDIKDQLVHTKSTNKEPSSKPCTPKKKKQTTIHQQPALPVYLRPTPVFERLNP